MFRRSFSKMVRGTLSSRSSATMIAGGDVTSGSQDPKKVQVRYEDIIARMDLLEREILRLSRMYGSDASSYVPNAGAAAAAQNVATAAAAAASGKGDAANENIKTDTGLDVHTPASQDVEDLDAPLTPEEFDDCYQICGQQPEFLVPVKTLLNVQTEEDLVRIGNLLSREFAIRTAKRCKALSVAPFGISAMPSIVELKRWYEMSFRDVRSVGQIRNREDLFKFDAVLRRIFKRHWNTSDLLSKGMKEFSHREMWTKEHLDDPSLYHGFEDIQNFFDEFCSCRVLLRFAINHQLMATDAILGVKDALPGSRGNYFGNDPDDFVGAIGTRTSIVAVTQHAVQDAMREFYTDSEAVKEQEISIDVAGDPDFRIETIPGWAFDVISAIVAEAVRANFIRREANGSPCTPVKILISQGAKQRDVVVRVSDTAGGMRSQRVNLSKSYINSCRSYFEDNELMLTDSTIYEGLGWRHSPIRIPYATVAAKCFGGDLTVASVKGVGTDRQFYIPIDGLRGMST